MKSSLFASGEPMLWLTGGSLVICAAMVAGLLLLVAWKGLTTFWPQPVLEVETSVGKFMGEVTRQDRFTPPDGFFEDVSEQDSQRARSELAQPGSDNRLQRRLFRTGNFRLTQKHFEWVNEFEVTEEQRPEWALTIERLEWGRFYGRLEGFAEIEPLEPGSIAAVEDLERAAARLSEPSGEDQVVVFKGSPLDLETVALTSLRADPETFADSVSDVFAVGRLVGNPAKSWQAFEDHHPAILKRWSERRHLEKHEIGAINRVQEGARLNLRAAELELAKQANGSADQARATEEVERARLELAEKTEWANQEFVEIREQIEAINAENERFQLVMKTSGEGAIAPRSTLVKLDQIARAYPANRLGLWGRLQVYGARWVEFLWDEPREANSEGGVFPAIFGTLAMTMIMSLTVVPFGVLAALYLREYARAGVVVSAVRIAVNNLAGVPSIVFGVFGLGFFCYVVGASLDELFFAAQLPNPTFGKGGLLWASLTLALLTLPVVIVATEEAISAVPNSMREGSYACGASKWQTIKRIVLPRAMPGIITGMILALARGAGEVAPLMLVGAVKLAPELPLDGIFPYIHAERSFMHLGFHIYDVGFQSQNSEAAKPMVFTTTLLLIALVAVLNFTTVWIRGRLRKKFASDQF